MNKNRTIQSLAFASMLTAVLAAPAFAQQGTQIPSTVPSQELQMQPAPMPPPAMPPMAAPMPPPPGTIPQASYSAPQSALSQHPNAPLQAKQVGDVTYITGGVGDKEMDQLKAESGNYNLQVMNSDGTGHFIASTNLVISGNDGREMIRVDNTGPLFYAQLPPGEYKVEATHGDKHETRAIKVSAKGKQSDVYLIWK